MFTDQPADNAVSESVVGRRGHGAKDETAAGWCMCSAPPMREHVHGPRRAERSRGDDVRRIVEEGQGDGVQKLAGRTPTARRRADRDRDRAQRNWHERGGRRDGDRGDRGGGWAQSCEGGMLSMSTATDQSSSS